MRNTKMNALEFSIIDRENIHAKLRFIGNVIGMIEDIDCAEGFGPDAPLALSLLLHDIALEVFPEGRMPPFTGTDDSPAVRQQRAFICRNLRRIAAKPHHARS